MHDATPPVSPSASIHSWRAACVDADEAVRHIAPGHRVFVGSGAAAPQSLLAAFARRATHLHDVEISHLLTLGSDPTTDASLEDRVRHRNFFIGANSRRAVHEGRADYVPIFLSEIPNLFKRGALPVDVAMITVSPPDRHGFCTFGVSVDVVKAATEAARCVIAEINPNMPRVHGDGFLHLSAIDHRVWSDRPLPELPAHASSEVTEAIGRHVAALVDDGATLQLGIGAIPDAVLRNLGARNDLGIHTEMFSDGVLPLIRDGVINGRRKTVNRRTIVTSFVIGSRALYDFVDDNPVVAFRPSQYTNDPFLIAQHDDMVAINSALEVDLTGQVCADSIGPRFYSGIGGQVDFVRGAARSRGGKPIIALPSTAKNGTVSRIVLQLSEGAGVVTTRGDVHWVVTEYGAAHLHGKSIRDRAAALIEIAHPDVRPTLRADARQRGYLSA
ncbi:MAG: acetyl-CoA hydrolase/transferase C-terminal domain-containing protein [Acidobacteriota bacterium]